MPLNSRAAVALVLLFQYLDPVARASVFITHPYKGIACSGGSSCTATWADDGLTPLLAAVGPSDFALFQGTNTLVQQLAVGLDVSQTRELTFVPNPNAGPNADSYWIKLTSLSARNPNDTSQAYTSFSGLFTLDNMSGAAGSPVASLTSSLTSSSSPSTSGASVSSGPQTQTQTSNSLTNGVVSTTTLSGIVPTGSASTLSSAISALSAISSAASGGSNGLLTTSPGGSSSTARSESGTGTASAAAGNSSSSGSLGNTSFLVSGGKLSATLCLMVLTTGIGAGIL